MSVYDDMAPEDILRMEQETEGPEMDMQARFRDIESLCRRLEMQMKSFPELRLGQLLSNALRCTPEDLHQRLFYIEDKELIETVVEFVKYHISTTIQE